jgi:hypothetical protein
MQPKWVMQLNFIIDLILHGNSVSVPDGNATFTCVSIHDIVDSISWFFNDTEVMPLSRQYVFIDLLPIGTGIGRLEIIGIPEHLNVTRIRCTAEVAGRTLYSNQETLLLQG